MVPDPYSGQKLHSSPPSNSVKWSETPQPASLRQYKAHIFIRSYNCLTLVECWSRFKE